MPARGGLLCDLGQLDAVVRCFERAIELGADPELHGYCLAAVRRVRRSRIAYVGMLFDQYSVDFERIWWASCNNVSTSGWCVADVDAHGFAVASIRRGSLHKNRQAQLDVLYVYLE